MIQIIKDTYNKYKLPVAGGLILTSPVSVPLVLNCMGLPLEVSIAISASLFGINYTMIRMKE